MNRWKLILALCLTILVAVLVVQNRAPVETHFLFATVAMSHAILLFLTALAGFVLGVLVTWLVGKRRDKQTEEPL